ncbi:branched-chain alpha-keto acid dehydrogenase subunit E2 [Mycolicibacterium fortuitum]|uniref:dihydrolipoamide acetyltransferase family protein n=1 Tax=Mycolicibacterium fortuitum TaxID=1766 RepID=UPI0007EA8D3F|nr:dihydrolipoamide acetyltransferase family protein [Mycolicibacterium fortuitum]OBA92683.1 branched-chain alpha-keto acid dehydrogenase subunit E2 [Mycolicibacterium fortuitum]OBI70895.1 branched-chain alpha-keto acid dehydrogenase subunit E2 [Mycolicibacterium fortuitum]
MTDNAELFHLPDVGEGLTEAEIVSWRVEVGDEVAINQVIVEIETAKSLVELPSPYAGTVIGLMAEAGQTVAVGTPIIAIAAKSASEEPKLLVGYGSRDDGQAGRRRRRAQQSAVEPRPPATGRSPRAKPPVRKLARVLGVDLAGIEPSGLDGIVTRADVLAAHGTDPVVESASGATQSDAVTRIPIKGVRKHMAAAMVQSAFTAPHVTEFVTVDMTETLVFKDRLAQHRDFRGAKITPLALVARAYLLALARTPIANGHWDEQAQEIVVSDAVNLGIAAATDRGLVVPNIRAANRLSLRQLVDEITELASTARAGKTPPEAMRDGTTTITNVGVFGVDTGTPILNPGETAILAVGAIRRLPWVVGTGSAERIEPRSVLQLALSFDHRVLDGQHGSQLLADTAAVLADPGMGLL